jgi:hypothetical protein
MTNAEGDTHGAHRAAATEYGSRNPPLLIRHHFDVGQLDGFAVEIVFGREV